MKKVSKVLIVILMMFALTFTFSVNVNAASDDDWEEVKEVEKPAETPAQEEKKPAETPAQTPAQEEKKPAETPAAQVQKPAEDKAKKATESHPQAGSIKVVTYASLLLVVSAGTVYAYKKLKRYNY